MKQPLLVTFSICLTLTACARFHTTQTDRSFNDKGELTRSITTRAGSTTFLDSKSALSSFKASQTDKTQGASVGALQQEANGTNTVAALEAIAHIVGALSK